jgi:2-deoxy-D-gluconate 3-dehydrogenase
MILDKFRLDSKVAIVTGCSTGLGQGIAIALAEAGADIVGVNRREAFDSKRTVESLGRRYLSLKADLTSIKPIDGIITDTIATFGKIDILVNNAGTIRRAEALEFTEPDWDDVLNLNLKTLFFFSQAVARQFVTQGTGGKIINIASMLSYQGGIRVASYTASKSGVMGITRLLANEWARYNINVNAIAPGYMATDNTAPIRSDPGRNQAILERIPAGRWGTPEDLQGMVVCLASEASNYINGYTIAVDGGWLAR